MPERIVHETIEFVYVAGLVTGDIGLEDEYYVVQDGYAIYFRLNMCALEAEYLPFAPG